ncbi:MBL fold metallo-hydrolase [Vibrio ouci]|uniref:MBL fold metallo-hydrolase n=1 Tax=Vibrio ouci TaxID=2499078 RepID=A0A4Y8WJ56_9VIBR|nr:MBL fold metallo-hydrolase [Vibrio ouci]TFH92854.1 MBL fold metallo-hydrolase [Vibrio ouci]
MGLMSECGFLEYKVQFHSVGQGLFSTGEIDWKGESFRFLYDCGTSSKRVFLNDQISKIHIKTIDLAVISHFDSDHTNGLEELLKKVEIKVLLLPYMALDQRLYAAMSKGLSSSSDKMKFYLDPCKYLNNKFPGKIKNIVFVTSDRGSQPNAIETDDFSFDPINVLGKVNKVGGYSNVFQISDSDKLMLEEIFEFITYNDESLSANKNKSFSNAVEKEMSVLLDGTARTVEGSLKKIKAVYDRTFGSSGENRNIISLFLYCSPIDKIDNFIVHQSASNYESRLSKGDKKSGILFTGDGSLSTKEQLQGLFDGIGEARLANLACLQVMHHGAQNNWHKGVAGKLQPAVSVFSSDPKRKKPGHPSAEVVKDFLPFSPYQVDKEYDLVLEFNNYIELLSRELYDMKHVF